VCGCRHTCFCAAAAVHGVVSRRRPRLWFLRRGRRVIGRRMATAAPVITERRPPHVCLWSGAPAATPLAAVRRPLPLLSLCGRRLSWCCAVAATLVAALRLLLWVWLQGGRDFMLRGGHHTCCGAAAATLRVVARRPLRGSLLRCGRCVNGRGATTAAQVAAERRPPQVLLWTGATATTPVALVRRPPPLLSLRGCRRTWCCAAAATRVVALRRPPFVSLCGGRRNCRYVRTGCRAAADTGVWLYGGGRASAFFAAAAV